MQDQYDDYIVQEVVPFVRQPLPERRHRRLDDGRVARRLSRREHAAEASRHRQALLRAVGRLRHEALHGRRLRRQLLLQQPSRLRRQPDRRLDAGITSRAATSIWRPAPARGSIATRRTACRASSRAAASAHHLDDWGPQGGHDWPYWQHQMCEYDERTCEARCAMASVRGLRASASPSRSLTAPAVQQVLAALIT